MKVQELVAQRGRPVQMLSITLDPERDTPDVLSEYRKAHGAGPGWTFLSGEHEDIERLRHALGVYDPDPIVDADRSQHAGLLVYGDDRLGRWSAIYSLAPPGRIVEAIERLLEP